MGHSSLCYPSGHSKNIILKTTRIFVTNWQPLTCGCVFEIEGIEWKKTIKKCDLHNDLTGQRLYQEVLRHNREISKSRVDPTKGEYIEGVIELDLEPTWLTEAMKKPTMLKIAEAEYNFKRMVEFHPTTKEFQFYLSNFLNSTRSVFYYLLEEYSQKYNIRLETYFKDERYRTKIESSMSEESKKFVEWYKIQYQELMINKTNGGFLIEKRDYNIHTGYVEQIFKHQQPFHLSGKQLKEGQDMPIDLNQIFPVFPENTEIDMRTLCDRFLESIRQLVKMTYTKF